MRLSTTRQRRGGAKVNLLIGVIVGGLALALIVPAIETTREAQARTQSINNLKLLAVSMHGFQDSNKALPFNGSDRSVEPWNFKAEAVLNDSSRTGSWGFQILPYTISLMDMWPKVRELDLFCYWCPGRDRPKQEVGKGAWTDYFINNYLNEPEKAGTPDNPRARRRLDDFTDGTANTILLGHGNIATGDYEKASGVVGSSNIFLGGTWGTARGGRDWKPGEPLSVELRRDSPTPPDFSKGGWGGPFSQGGLFAFGDGMVRIIPYTTSPDLFAAMLTPSGKEEVELPD